MTAQGEAELRRRVVAHDWWHTIELAPGVLTPGGWDLPALGAEQQAPTAEQTRLQSAAIQRELAPILERLQRLEDRLN